MVVPGVIAMIGAGVIEIAIMCCRDFARRVPINYIALLVFTLLESFALAVICAKYEKVVCLMAAGSTAAVTCGLTSYAFWTKRDFSVLGQLMIVVCFAVSFLLIFSCFFSFA